MKYEAVFGDQKRFNEQNNEMAEVMLWHDFLGPNFVSLKELSRMNSEGSIPHGSVVLAMRRIIAEPKRWTLEDKKAGQLPEVGAEVQFNFYQSAVMRQGVIKYIDDQVAVIQTEDVTRPFCYETCKVVFTPIETPEEKAERLEDEFVNELMKDKSVIYTSSEQLAMCRKAARAAYRKLSGTLSAPTKGGER